MRPTIALVALFATAAWTQATTETTVSDWLTAGYEIKGITAAGGGGASKKYFIYFQKGTRFARCLSDQDNNIIDCSSSE